jgi:FMN phosphatase YigB (HAD superfamily)
MKRKSPKAGGSGRIVFLFDVDNTLLDNDGVTADLKRHLEKEVGRKGAQSYWSIFKQLRAELGYADYLGALQRYRSEGPHEPHLLTISRFLIDYPFADRLFPSALEVCAHVKRSGAAVILSDGDVVFQPRKVERSGLFKAVQGQVLIYVHKEEELADVQERFPADHYVMVDDKLRILAAIKKVWGRQVTTVFVRQGHYALDPKILAAYPPADVSIDRIGDLLAYECKRLAESLPIVLTIGHSTRTLEEFISLLKAHGATCVVDVRTVPRSRHNPQFNKASLPRALKNAGLGYVHLPGLGGLRHALRDSPNVGWRNASFRGYADYMQTPEFKESLEELIRLANQDRVALMCAEAVPWCCHRSLIADALLVRRIQVEDILTPTRGQVHKLTPFAKVRGTTITYPAEVLRSTPMKPAAKRAKLRRSTASDSDGSNP